LKYLIFLPSKNNLCQVGLFFIFESSPEEISNHCSPSALPINRKCVGVPSDLPSCLGSNPAPTRATGSSSLISIAVFDFDPSQFVSSFPSVNFSINLSFPFSLTSICSAERILSSLFNCPLDEAASLKIATSLNAIDTGENISSFNLLASIGCSNLIILFAPMLVACATSFQFSSAHTKTFTLSILWPNLMFSLN